MFRYICSAFIKTQLFLLKRQYTHAFREATTREYYHAEPIYYGLSIIKTYKKIHYTEEQIDDFIFLFLSRSKSPSVVKFIFFIQEIVKTQTLSQKIFFLEKLLKSDWYSKDMRFNQKILPHMSSWLERILHIRQNERLPYDEWLTLVNIFCKNTNLASRVHSSIRHILMNEKLDLSNSEYVEMVEYLDYIMTFDISLVSFYLTDSKVQKTLAQLLETDNDHYWQFFDKLAIAQKESVVSHSDCPWDVRLDFFRELYCKKTTLNPDMDIFL